MKKYNDPFGPKNDEEALIFNQEGLRVDFQVSLNELMLEQGVSKEELWERIMNTCDTAVSYSKVDAIFNDDVDITIGDIAAVLHVLGHKLKIVFEKDG